MPFVRSVSEDNKSESYNNYHNGIVLAPIPPKFEGFVEGFEPDYKPKNSIYIRDVVNKKTQSLGRYSQLWVLTINTNNVNI